MIHRRSFMAALTCGIICAPAIVRASSLMPVRSPPISVETVEKWIALTDKEIFDLALDGCDLDSSLQAMADSASIIAPRDSYAHNAEMRKFISDLRLSA